MEPEWFHPQGDVYGLQACHLSDVKEGLQKFLHDRVVECGSAQHFSTTLGFTGFSMTEEELERLRATVAALAHVRWQWISAWLCIEKIMM